MAKAEVKTVDSAAAEFAEAMATMAELMRPMGEAVDGYREEALRRGYSPTAAEQMAMSYHEHLLTLIRPMASGK